MFHSYYYTASAKVGIWQANKSISGAQQFQIDQLLKSFSGGVLEVNEKNLGVVEDTALLSLISIIEKILSRGNPTISLFDFESRLVKSAANNLNNVNDLSVDPNSRIVGYSAEIPVEYDLTSILKSFLISQHTSDNLKIIQKKSLDEHLQKITSKEEDLFWNAIKNKISPEFQSIFIRQPLLEHLILDSSNNFIRNRVDFACIHPDLRIVIEIDGEQHKDDDSQNQDGLRKQALNKDGWEVLRFSAHNVRTNVNVCIDELVQYLQTNKFDVSQLKLHQAYLKKREDKLS